MAANESAEAWRPIEWADGWYDVSSHGRVRSWKKLVGLGRGNGCRVERAEAPAPIRDAAHSRGYRYVALNLDGRQVVRTVHSLVAEAFLGQRPEGAQVCHFDGDKTNNHVTNLRYDSPAANAADRYRQGTMTGKLSVELAASVRELYAAGGVTQPALAERFGVSLVTINRTIRGAAWRTA